MIDLDNIEKIARETFLNECKYLSTKGLISLIDRLREAEADAKRWRKLVEMNDDSSCELAVCTWHGGYEYSMVPDLLEVIDAHIDEAMNHEAS